MAKELAAAKPLTEDCILRSKMYEVNEVSKNLIYFIRSASPNTIPTLAPLGSPFAKGALFPAGDKKFSKK